MPEPGAPAVRRPATGRCGAPAPQAARVLRPAARAAARRAAPARRGRHLRAVHRARRRASRSCDGSGVARARPEHAPGARPAPSPARCRRRCSPSSAWTAWCSATPSGASTSARPTARCRRRCPAALEAGLRPILCVGETEEEREAGETERKLRHQVQEGLEKVADRAARRGGDRLRADLGDRHRQGRHARAGAGGDRVRARAGRRPLEGGRRARCASSTAAA